MTSFGVDAYKASEKDLLAEGVTLHGASEEATYLMALTEWERAILRLWAGGLNDYRIARRLHSYTNSVKHSRLNALKKIEWARVDLEFTDHVGVKNGKP